MGQGTETVAVQQVRLRRSNRGVTGLDSLNLVPDPGFVLGSGSSPDPDPESRPRFFVTIFFKFKNKNRRKFFLIKSLHYISS